MMLTHSIVSVFFITLIIANVNPEKIVQVNHDNLLKQEADDPFILAIEKQAKSLSIHQFDSDPILLQVVDRLNSETYYKLPQQENDTNTKNPIVFTRDSTDSNKDVIVLSKSEDKLVVLSGRVKQVYVVLKKNPSAPKPTYYVNYAYLRNATDEDAETDIITVGEARRCIEWDTWVDRTVHQSLIWTDCASTVLVSCHFNSTYMKTIHTGLTPKLNSPSKESSDTKTASSTAETFFRVNDDYGLYSDLDVQQMEVPTAPIRSGSTVAVSGMKGRGFIGMMGSAMGFSAHGSSGSKKKETSPKVTTGSGFKVYVKPQTGAGGASIKGYGGVGSSVAAYPTVSMAGKYPQSSAAAYPTLSMAGKYPQSSVAAYPTLSMTGKYPQTSTGVAYPQPGTGAVTYPGYIQPPPGSIVTTITTTKGSKTKKLIIIRAPPVLVYPVAIPMFQLYTPLPLFLWQIGIRVGGYYIPNDKRYRGVHGYLIPNSAGVANVFYPDSPSVFGSTLPNNKATIGAFVLDRVPGTSLQTSVYGVLLPSPPGLPAPFLRANYYIRITFTPMNGGKQIIGYQVSGTRGRPGSFIMEDAGSWGTKGTLKGTFTSEGVDGKSTGRGWEGMLLPPSTPGKPLTLIPNNIYSHGIFKPDDAQYPKLLGTYIPGIGIPSSILPDIPEEFVRTWPANVVLRGVFVPDNLNQGLHELTGNLLVGTPGSEDPIFLPDSVGIAGYFEAKAANRLRVPGYYNPQTDGTGFFIPFNQPYIKTPSEGTFQPLPTINQQPAKDITGNLIQQGKYFLLISQRQGGPGTFYPDQGQSPIKGMLVQGMTPNDINLFYPDVPALQYKTLPGTFVADNQPGKPILIPDTRGFLVGSTSQDPYKFLPYSVIIPGHLYPSDQKNKKLHGYLIPGQPGRHGQLILDPEDTVEFFQPTKCIFQPEQPGSYPLSGTVSPSKIGQSSIFIEDTQGIPGMLAIDIIPNQKFHGLYVPSDGYGSFLPDDTNAVNLIIPRTSQFGMFEPDRDKVPSSQMIPTHGIITPGTTKTDPLTFFPDNSPAERGKLTPDSHKTLNIPGIFIPPLNRNPGRFYPSDDQIIGTLVPSEPFSGLFSPDKAKNGYPVHGLYQPGNPPLFMVDGVKGFPAKFIPNQVPNNKYTGQPILGQFYESDPENPSKFYITNPSDVGTKIPPTATKGQMIPNPPHDQTPLIGTLLPNSPGQPAAFVSSGYEEQKQTQIPTIDTQFSPNKPTDDGIKGEFIPDSNSQKRVHGKLYPPSPGKPGRFVLDDSEPDSESSLNPGPYSGTFVPMSSESTPPSPLVITVNPGSKVSEVPLETPKVTNGLMVPDDDPSLTIPGFLSKPNNPADPLRFFPQNPNQAGSFSSNNQNVLVATFQPDMSNPSELNSPMRGKLFPGNNSNNDPPIFIPESIGVIFGKLLPSTDPQKEILGTLLATKPQIFFPDLLSELNNIHPSQLTKVKFVPDLPTPLSDVDPADPASGSIDGQILFPPSGGINPVFLPDGTGVKGIFSSDSNPYYKVPGYLTQPGDVNSPQYFVAQTPSQLHPSNALLTYIGLFKPDGSNSKSQIHGKLVPTNKDNHMFIPDPKGSTGKIILSTVPNKPINGTIISGPTLTFLPDSPMDLSSLPKTPTSSKWIPDPQSSGSKGPLPQQSGGQFFPISENANPIFLPDKGFTNVVFVMDNNPSIKIPGFLTNAESPPKPLSFVPQSLQNLNILKPNTKPLGTFTSDPSVTSTAGQQLKTPLHGKLESNNGQYIIFYPDTQQSGNVVPKPSIPVQTLPNLTLSNKDGMFIPNSDPSNQIPGSLFPIPGSPTKFIPRDTNQISTILQTDELVDGIFIPAPPASSANMGILGIALPDIPGSLKLDGDISNPPFFILRAGGINGIFYPDSNPDSPVPGTLIKSSIPPTFIPSNPTDLNQQLNSESPKTTGSFVSNEPDAPGSGNLPIKGNLIISNGKNPYFIDENSKGIFTPTNNKKVLIQGYFIVGGPGYPSSFIPENSKDLTKLAQKGKPLDGTFTPSSSTNKKQPGIPGKLQITGYPNSPNPVFIPNQDGQHGSIYPTNNSKQKIPGTFLVPSTFIPDDPDSIGNLQDPGGIINVTFIPDPNVPGAINKPSNGQIIFASTTNNFPIFVENTYCSYRGTFAADNNPYFTFPGKVCTVPGKPDTFIGDNQNQIQKILEDGSAVGHFTPDATSSSEDTPPFSVILQPSGYPLSPPIFFRTEDSVRGSISPTPDSQISISGTLVKKPGFPSVFIPDEPSKLQNLENGLVDTVFYPEAHNRPLFPGKFSPAGSKDFPSFTPEDPDSAINIFIPSNDAQEQTNDQDSNNVNNNNQETIDENTNNQQNIDQDTNNQQNIDEDTNNQQSLNQNSINQQNINQNTNNQQNINQNSNNQQNIHQTTNNQQNINHNTSNQQNIYQNTNYQQNSNQNTNNQQNSNQNTNNQQNSNQNTNNQQNSNQNTNNQQNSNQNTNYQQNSNQNTNNQQSSNQNTNYQQNSNQNTNNQQNSNQNTNYQQNSNQNTNNQQNSNQNTNYQQNTIDINAQTDGIEYSNYQQNTDHQSIITGVTATFTPNLKPTVSGVLVSTGGKGSQKYFVLDNPNVISKLFKDEKTISGEFKFSSESSTDVSTSSGALSGTLQQSSNQIGPIFSSDDKISSGFFIPDSNNLENIYGQMYYSASSSSISIFFLDNPSDPKNSKIPIGQVIEGVFQIAQGSTVVHGSLHFETDYSYAFFVSTTSTQDSTSSSTSSSTSVIGYYFIIKNGGQLFISYSNGAHGYFMFDPSPSSSSTQQMKIQGSLMPGATPQDKIQFILDNSTDVTNFFEANTKYSGTFYINAASYLTQTDRLPNGIHGTLIWISEFTCTFTADTAGKSGVFNVPPNSGCFVYDIEGNLVPHDPEQQKQVESAPRKPIKGVFYSGPTDNIFINTEGTTGDFSADDNPKIKLTGMFTPQKNPEFASFSFPNINALKTMLHGRQNAKGTFTASSNSKTAFSGSGSEGPLMSIHGEITMGTSPSFKSDITGRRGGFIPAIPAVPGFMVYCFSKSAGSLSTDGSNTKGTYFRSTGPGNVFVPNSGVSSMIKADTPSDFGATSAIQGYFKPSLQWGGAHIFKQTNRHNLPGLTQGDVSVSLTPKDSINSGRSVHGTISTGESPDEFIFTSDVTGDIGTFTISTTVSMVPLSGRSIGRTLGKPNTKSLNSNEKESTNEATKIHGMYLFSKEASKFVPDFGVRGKFIAKGNHTITIPGNFYPFQDGTKMAFVPISIGFQTPVRNSASQLADIVEGIFCPLDDSKIFCPVEIQGSLTLGDPGASIFTPSTPGQRGTYVDTSSNSNYKLFNAPVNPNIMKVVHGKTDQNNQNKHILNQINSELPDGVTTGSKHGVYYTIGNGAQEVFIADSPGTHGHFKQSVNSNSPFLYGFLFARINNLPEIFIPDAPMLLFSIGNQSLEGSFTLDDHGGVGIQGRLLACNKTGQYTFAPNKNGVSGWFPPAEKSATNSMGRSFSKVNHESEGATYPGWKTQFQGDFPNVTLKFESEIFFGLGNCPFKKVLPGDLKNAKSQDQIIAFYTTLLRTNCLTEQTEHIRRLISDEFLELKNKMLLVHANNKYLKQKKLSKRQLEELSSAFEMSIFSQTYAKEAINGNTVDRSLSPNGNIISRSTRFLVNMGLNAIVESRKNVRKHFVRLSRNIITTINTGFSKLLEDIDSLAGCNDCEMDITINYNDRVQLMAFMEFMMHGLNAAEKNEDVQKHFEEFYISNISYIRDKVDALQNHR